MSQPRRAEKRLPSQRDQLTDCGRGMKSSSLSVQIQRAKYSPAVRASAAIVESRSLHPGHSGCRKRLVF